MILFIMRIIVKAKTRAREEKVEIISQSPLDFGGGESKLEVYKVSVKEPPVSGRANQAITKALAKHFDVSPSKVMLTSGQTAKQKIFEID